MLLKRDKCVDWSTRNDRMGGGGWQPVLLAIGLEVGAC
jgi:hypothetical protein